MQDDQPPRSVSSSAWTGPPPDASCKSPKPGFQPRWSPSERREQAIAGLLSAGCVLVFLVWYVVLGSHSTVVPSPETGRTEALNLFSAKGRRIYVTSAEALTTYALLVAAFVVPVGYVLGREALHRRSKR